jgi:hypothetical protein
MTWEQLSNFLDARAALANDIDAAAYEWQAVQRDREAVAQRELAIEIRYADLRDRLEELARLAACDGRGFPRDRASLGLLPRKDPAREEVVELYRRLTGREPTQEELAEAREAWREGVGGSR